jgi:hypothetical protein
MQSAHRETRLFRIVFTSATSLRLMDKAADDPSTWGFPFDSVPVRLVTVRDIVALEQGLPRHLGLEFAVEMEGDGLDQAASAARTWAESVAFTLAAARRAPVGRLAYLVAYEITPGIDEREFRQWFWDPPIPVSKPVADPGVLGPLRDQMEAAAEDSEAAERLPRAVISLGWFRQALDETDPLFRFHKLWVAVEALNAPLDDLFEIPKNGRSGFQGVRRLCEESGFGSRLVSEALNLRRHLYHAMGASSTDELRRTAEALMPRLESVCIAAWKRLLHIGADFPATSVWPYPLHFRVDGVAHHKDESKWGPGAHPHLEANFNFERVATDDPGEVTFQLSTRYTVRNMDGFGALAHGLWGPTGYSALRSDGETRIDVERGSEGTTR